MNIKQFIGDSKFFVVAFDRSGSTPPEIAKKEQKALRAGLEGLTNYTAVVLAFDRDLHLVGNITSASDVTNLEIPMCGGGTLLQPVANFTKKIGADKLIVFTDGFIPDMEPVVIPTLFVVHDPFGMPVLGNGNTMPL